MSIKQRSANWPPFSTQKHHLLRQLRGWNMRHHHCQQFRGWTQTVSLSLPKLITEPKYTAQEKAAQRKPQGNADISPTNPTVRTLHITQQF